MLNPPPVLAEFIRRFNAGSFWESHEVLEHAWRATGSDFYQGLILLASAFVHVRRANVHGVRAQLAKAVSRLAAYRPGYLGLDVDRLLEAADAASRAAEVGVLPVAPELVLEAGLLRGTEPELRATLEGPPPVE